MNSERSDLSERAQLMLRALIDRYVLDGQPVGSRTPVSYTHLTLPTITE